jgi:uncharacterized protein (TIGR03792 family)
VVIELLRVKVPLHIKEAYIQKDAEIWTAALASYPGFLGKEVWLNPKDPTEIVIVIRWETRELWKAIPEEDVIAVDAKFTQALGEYYPLVESSEYKVLRTHIPHPRVSHSIIT